MLGRAHECRLAPADVARRSSWPGNVGQDLRYEFDGVAAIGHGGRHGRAQRDCDQSRPGAGRPLAWRPVPRRSAATSRSSLAGRVRYPDAVVTCSHVANDADIVPDPVIVFEVLSSSTASTDRIEKNEEYRATPSIQRYLMLEQTRRAATVFSRSGDDWVGHVLTGDAALAMPEIGVALALAELYAGIEFAEFGELIRLPTAPTPAHKRPGAAARSRPPPTPRHP